MDIWHKMLSRKTFADWHKIYKSNKNPIINDNIKKSVRKISCLHDQNLLIFTTNTFYMYGSFDSFYNSLGFM